MKRHVITCLASLFWLMLVQLATSQESLVISTIVDDDDSHWAIVELTACSSIANLSRYNLKQFNVDATSPPSQEYIWDPINISAGSRIYFSSLFESDFVNFFGFQPEYFSWRYGIVWNGNANFQLVFDEVTLMDAYGIVGSQVAGTPADYYNGWAGRKPYQPATASFNVSHWNVHLRALDSYPVNNSYVNPPTPFQAYICPDNDHHHQQAVIRPKSKRRRGKRKKRRRSHHPSRNRRDVIP